MSSGKQGGLDLQRLLSALIGRGLQQAVAMGVDEKSAGAATTIRLSPEARAFYAAQAEAFGQMSMSSFIAMTLEGVMRETQGSNSDQPQRQLKHQIELTRDRVLHLFRSHGYEPQEIAVFLSEFGVTVSTLHDEKAFIDAISNELLDKVRRHFHAPYAWLGSEQNYSWQPRGIWYKSTEGAIRRLVALTKAGRMPEVLVLRSRKARFEEAFERGDKAAYEPVGIVIRKQHSQHGRVHKLYETWEFQRWNYGKCRHYLKALIEWIERQSKAPTLYDRIYVQGLSIDPGLLEKLQSGQLTPAEVLEIDRQDGSTMWYPDDLMDPKLSSEKSEIDYVLQHYCDQTVFDRYLAALTDRDLDSQPTESSQRLNKAVLETEEDL